MKNVEEVPQDFDIDIIYYFVNSENLGIKSEKLKEIANYFSNVLGFRSHEIRIGPEVQDPKSLYEELKDTYIDMFDIISVENKKEISLLSHAQKELFFNSLLTTKTQNTGILAKEVMDTIK